MGQDSSVKMFCISAVLDTLGFEKFVGEKPGCCSDSYWTSLITEGIEALLFCPPRLIPRMLVLVHWRPHICISTCMQ
jgi:hypothetical protein